MEHIFGLFISIINNKMLTWERETHWKDVAGCHNRTDGEQPRSFHDGPYE